MLINTNIYFITAKTRNLLICIYIYIYIYIYMFIYWKTQKHIYIYITPSFFKNKKLYKLTIFKHIFRWKKNWDLFLTANFFFQNLKIIINLLHNEKKIICWILKCFIKNIINVFRLSPNPLKYLPYYNFILKNIRILFKIKIKIFN